MVGQAWVRVVKRVRRFAQSVASIMFLIWVAVAVLVVVALLAGA